MRSIDFTRASSALIPARAIAKNTIATAGRQKAKWKCTSLFVESKPTKRAQQNVDRTQASLHHTLAVKEDVAQRKRCGNHQPGKGYKACLETISLHAAEVIPYIIAAHSLILIRSQGQTEADDKAGKGQQQVDCLLALYHQACSPSMLSRDGSRQ